MKTAVVYYSMSGNCKFVAEQIATVLQCDQIRVEPVKSYPDKGARKFYWGGKSAIMGEKPELKPYEFNKDEYDCVIIGYPVWASNVTPPIRTFIAENAEALKTNTNSSVRTNTGSSGTKKISGTPLQQMMASAGIK